jgi:serine phosphatase RsbU (regulator of sigma subunit)
MDMYHVMPFRKMVDTLSPGYFLMNLVTTALFLFFLIFRNEKLRLQLVSELRGSNKMILEKNQEITDSINYGRRIQNALLPQAEAMSKLFPQSFVLYKPKDIVSGDFYWISEKGGEAFLGVADCTGHGVPGAFMSMIGTSVLNQAVNEKSISDVGLVLQDLNTGIVSSLKQNETATHDGMDIALIKLNKERNKLYYAAANRPLYLVRNNELFEHKPTKQPIGGFYMEQEKNFTVTEIELQNGDCIFLSTDGFADQFGGEKNKKMTTKNFKVLLSEMGNKTPAEQQSYLDDKFTRWKGQYEQMDDVLVVGIGI